MADIDIVTQNMPRIVKDHKTNSGTEIQFQIKVDQTMADINIVLDNPCCCW